MFTFAGGTRYFLALSEKSDQR